MITVLFVEDDVDNRFVIEYALRSMGMVVISVVDGQDALDVLEQIVPDVILLDLLLPSVSGFDVLAQYPGPVPIVVYSAWTDMTNLPREPFAVVLKPADVREELAPILFEAARSWRV